MKTNPPGRTNIHKALLFVLPVLLLLGFAAPSAQARDHYRERHHHEYRHGYVERGYYGNGGRRYHDSYYRGRPYRDGYWRYRRGHRYWYEDGGYYVRPGGISINIGL